MSDFHLFSPSGCADDARCRRITFWRRVFGGVGIEPAGFDLDLIVGGLAHGACKGMIGGENADALAAEAVGIVTEAFEAEEHPALTGEERECLRHEHANLVRGLVHALEVRVLPRVAAEYEIVAAEEERSRRVAPGIALRSTPDLILRAKDWALPGLGYLELKSTSFIGPGWFAQWQTNPQTWAGKVVLAEKHGEPLTWFQVQGLYKGSVREGVRSSVFCYGWRNVTPSERLEPNPSRFFMGEVLYSFVGERGRGWEKFPAHKFPGGVKAWVANMPGEVIDAQLPCTPPILIDDGLVEAWLRQEVLRQEEIAEGARLLNGTENLPEDVALTILDTTFKQSFNQCDPAVGRACAFKAVCHNPAVAADPVGSGKYVWRKLRSVEVEEEKAA